MASGHVSRIQRPNTWLHRPMLLTGGKLLLTCRQVYGTRTERRRSSMMQGRIAIAMILLVAPAAAMPSVEEARLRSVLAEPEPPPAAELQERYRLFDEIVDDVGADGFASELQELCQDFKVRYRRTDGVTVTRKVDRCL